jgi:hypothetical protein
MGCKVLKDPYCGAYNDNRFCVGGACGMWKAGDEAKEGPVKGPSNGERCGEITRVQQAIRDICRELEHELITKNRKYGDSAINPKRIFSKADALEQINVRLDDKMSRIMSSQADDDEDPEFDLMGYLVLKRVFKRLGAAGQ